MTMAAMSWFNMSRAITDYNILNPEHENFDAAKRLDRFKIANIEYIRSDSLASLKEPPTRRSTIWQFGGKLLG